ncbi:MAG: rhombosortase [Microbacteriaceae bacterium]|nr:rhombosortase [Burkholderiaceae bacterium]
MAGGVRLTVRKVGNTRNVRHPLRPVGPWWALALLAGVGALGVWGSDAIGWPAGAGAWGGPGHPGAPTLAGWLDWQPTLALQQPWRCITAAWVHLSGRHLVGNLAGIVLVAAFGRAAGCGGRATLAWAGAWPLTHAALALQPTLGHYGGLSGLLHAGVAVACWQLLRGGRGQRRAVGAAVLATLVLKLLLEAPWQGGPLRHGPGWDIAIAPLAHSSGALAGLLCAWACGVGGDAGRRVPRSA